MIYRILADGILIFHLAFILFAVFGGLIVVRWRKVIYLHVPAVVWAFAVQWFQWICPLTPLENSLRELGGQSGYPGDFLGYYLLKVVYIPAGPTLHTLVALFVIFLNLFIYYCVFSVSRRKVRDVR